MVTFDFCIVLINTITRGLNPELFILSFSLKMQLSAANIVVDGLTGDKSFTIKTLKSVDEYIIQVNCPCNLFVRIAPSFAASKLIFRSEIQGVFITIKPPYTNVPVCIYGTPVLTFDNVRGRFVGEGFDPIDVHRQCMQFRVHGDPEGKSSRLTIGIFGYISTFTELRHVSTPKWRSPFKRPLLIYSLRNQHLNTVELWGIPTGFPKAPSVKIYSANHVDKF